MTAPLGLGRRRPAGRRGSVLMRIPAGILLLLCASAAPAWAQQRPEPEEPGFAFLTGRSYTQDAGLLQVLWTTHASKDTFHSQGVSHQIWVMENTLRLEGGLTDDLEIDLSSGWGFSTGSVDGTPVGDERGLLDSLLGVRYRILNEASAPLTLTFGPQLLIPTGDPDKGFGTGKVGTALDLTLAKDWGGLFFAYASAAYEVTPEVDDPAPNSDRSFTLDAFTYAFALGTRLQKRSGIAGAVDEDLHLFLEFRGAREHRLESTAGGTRRSLSGPLEMGLGLRYGIQFPDQRLVEFGLMVTLGLNEAADDAALVLQIQWQGARQPQKP